MPSQPTSRDVDAIVRGEILRLLTARHRTVPAIDADDALSAALGLSSSEVAALVSHLWSRLGLGTSAVPTTDVRTVGDLCRAARKALADGGAAPSAETDPVEAARRRAETRRRGGPGP
jgi:hypothetical protein